MACPWWAGWKDVTVARPYPREFRDDVVRVARNRDDGVTIEQIASDFGVHPMTLSKWSSASAAASRTSVYRRYWIELLSLSDHTTRKPGCGYS